MIPFLASAKLALLRDGAFPRGGQIHRVDPAGLIFESFQRLFGPETPRLFVGFPASLT